MEALTINNTNTIQKIREIGGSIITRDNNHHVKFDMKRGPYEIVAKNNRDYQLNRLDSMNENYKKPIHFCQNPLELLDYILPMDLYTADELK